MKKSVLTLTIALLIVISMMAIGYSAFATELSINGTAEIVGDWNVKITNIEAEETINTADSGLPEYTDTTAKFNAKLKNPGDAVKYVITVQNIGSIDAKLDNVIFFSDEKNDSPAILYETSELSPILTAGETTTLTVTVQYDPNVKEVPLIKTKTIIGTLNYVQM